MGLDSIEILMEVEKTFDIKIPDQEAEKIITVGDFHNSVWKHLEGKHTNKCNSQSLFYRLRQSFADTFILPKQDVKLNTSPNNIFPQKNRRQVYFNFAKANNLKLPDLRLPPVWAVFLNTLGFSTVFGGLAFSLILINFFDWSKWTLLIPVAGIILTMIISELLDPKRIIVAPNSLKGFTENILAMNYANLVNNNGTNRREMEIVINHVIADKVGLELDEITPEKKIGDDLGIS